MTTTTRSRTAKGGTTTTRRKSTTSNAGRTPVRRVVRKPEPPKRIAEIPEYERYGENYIQRSFDEFGGLTEFILFDFGRQHAKNVLSFGPTGSGKTSAILAWAATRQYYFYSISSSIGIEPSQLFGKYIPDEDGEVGRLVWQDGPVTDIVRNGGLLLINELNFIPERIGTVLFSLLDMRREIQLMDHKGEIVRAHVPPDENDIRQCWCDLSDEECEERWVFIMADMNPDYEGTRPLNKAMRNRFPIQLYWDYEPEVEKALVGVDELTDLAHKLREAAKRGDFETPVSTNMLIEFKRFVQYLGLQFATKNFLNHFPPDEVQAVQVVFQTFEANLGIAFQKLHDTGKLPFLSPYGDPYERTDDDGTTLKYGEGWLYEEEEA